MKSKQFCSVCKDWLEMEVVPTGDGDDDDGVIWFRCPQCQGFLPKLSGADLQPGDDAGESDGGETPDAAAGDGEAAAADDTAPAATDDMPWDSPAEMMAARGSEAADPPVSPDDLDLDDVAALPDAEADAAPEAEAGGGDAEEDSGPPSEPIPEYAARLAAVDPSTSTPYRPWGTYEEGQCIHHLAWDDCGIVVGKEELPGGRKVIKCYFEEAGVVRLIEQAPR